jgi:ABC-type polysaccharide/polyol phosphate transport system ATPase subunit
MTLPPGAIVVENAGKRFALSAARRRGATDLREVFQQRQQRYRADTVDTAAFWALQDVSFTVEPGNALGIVGHNGSGKSTMLKLLTGIMKPTVGRVRVGGRVGALIEVGAGFHPDLTGRENVFLNGSILGLSRREVATRFDEIVAFAGLEKFIDTPVKRYSTGMYMRLGFSIAAHTGPDVLLVDEVLAVGDQFFQNKCLKRMNEYVAEGGTVILVSHAMGQVAQLCPECLWLDHGRLRYQGPTDKAVDQYLAVVAEREEEEFKRSHPEEWAIMEAERQREEARLRAEEEARLQAEEDAQRQQTGPMLDPNRSRVLGVRLLDAEGKARVEFQPGEPLQVRIRYRFSRPLPNPAFCFEVFRSSDGLHMFTTSNQMHDLMFDDLPLEGSVAFDVPYLTLSPGHYRIRLRLFSDWRPQDWNSCFEDVIENALDFSVVNGRYPSPLSYCIPVRWEATNGRVERTLVTAEKHG